MLERAYRIAPYRGKLHLDFRDPATGKRRRYNLGTDDPSTARQLAASVYDELTRPRGKTVRDVWEAYCRAKQGRAVIETMRHTWKAIEPSFGALEATHITERHCREHTERRRAAGIKDGTIHTELGHLRMVLVWASRHLDTAGQPMIPFAPAITRPSKPKTGEKHLTRDEVRRLIRACTMPHIRLFVILGVTTCGRREALLDLTWDRVDFERGLIDLRNPHLDRPHKGRAIAPMNRLARTALLEARAGALSEYVIEWAGRQVASVKKGLATASKEAGLRTVTHHMLRHSAAVHMAEDGVSMEEIREIMGHSDINVTRKLYARFSPVYLAKAAASLEYFDGPEGISGGRCWDRTNDLRDVNATLSR